MSRRCVELLVDELAGEARNQHVVNPAGARGTGQHVSPGLNAAGRGCNWAGNVTFSAQRFHLPRTVQQLQLIVRDADAVRAVGSGHSFSAIADTTGDLVSVDALPARLELDERAGLLTVSAGLTYGQVAARLRGTGWALANLASLPHLSVAGACATGTHGSGDGLQPLSAGVSGLEMVTGSGELATVRRGDKDFDGMVVALGCLGIVTSLQLELVPTYDVATTVYEDLPLAALTDEIDAVFSSGYSVSVFTTWQADVAEQVWVKQRVGDERAAGWVQGAKPADGPCHPVPGRDPEHCTEQGGRPGSWDERLPHFRIGSVPSSGQELQSEYLIPRASARDALAALHLTRQEIAPVLQICELRTVAGDAQWLSPAYQRDSLALHFTWTQHSAVEEAMSAVEGRLAVMQPRPHWGKLFTYPAQEVVARYPRLADFQALVADYDPTHKFRNATVDPYLDASA